MKEELPPVVNKRNEFGSIQAMVEDALGRYPEEGRIVSRQGMVEFLTRFAESVSRDCMYAYQKGADRGIEQAMNVMNDPEYYVTVKQRRKRAVERNAEYQEQQRVERLERDHDPEFRAQHITHLRQWIEEGKRNSERLEARLTAYLAMCEEPPKLVRLPMPPNIPNWQLKGFGKTIDTGIPGSFAGLQAVPDPVVKDSLTTQPEPAGPKLVP